MKKPIQISIPTPCHENWDAMTHADKGRFCGSCQKKVFDFTKSSDREIALVLKNANNACGRFTIHQLNRDLVIPKEKSSLWMAASAAIVSFLTIGNHTISAQTPVNIEQTDLKTDDINNKITSDKNIITGTVVDLDGLSVLGANIIVKGTERTSQTDFDGKFSIEANETDILEFTFVGIKTREIIISDKKLYNLIMPNEALLGDLIRETYGGISVQRTFFGRIFHSIGSIFR